MFHYPIKFPPPGSSRLLLLPAAIPALQVSRELLKIAESFLKDGAMMYDSLIFREKNMIKPYKTRFCWMFDEIKWLVFSSTGEDIVIDVFVRCQWRWFSRMEYMADSSHYQRC